MKKIVGFGDSFINYGSLGIDIVDSISWLNDLGLKLNLPVINYGCSGSAIDYSLHKFFQYYTSDEYDPNDIIVFVTTEPVSRNFTVTMPNPRLGVCTGQQENPTFTKVEEQYVKENVEKIFWHQFHCSNGEMNFKFIQTCSALQVWAESHSSNKLLLLRGFAHYTDENIEKYDVIIYPTTNFFPCIKFDQNLFTISMNEFTDLKLFNDLNNSYDSRQNHLTKSNRDILVSIVDEILKTGNTNLLDKSKFQDSLYKNKKDIEHLLKLTHSI